MVIRFDGQVAIVTGSGRGLGRAYAKLLAARGAQVVVHDAGVSLDGTGFDAGVADAVTLEITSEGGNALSCYENIESREGCLRLVDAALSRFGRLDILIHNAGWISFTALEEMSQALLERILNIQVAAPLWLSQAAFPIMRHQRYGRIVFTTSGRSMFLDDALPALSGYAIGKMAQLGLMNVLGKAGADDGICVNAISPVAATRMFRSAVAPGELRPEQVAPGVAFLASSQCDFSGVVLQASNGHFAAARWQRSAGVDFGDTEITPDDVAEQWLRIAEYASQEG